MAQARQVGPRTGGVRPPVIGKVQPSYAVDQKFDRSLMGNTLKKRLQELSDSLEKAEKLRAPTRIRTERIRDQKIKKDVAPFAQQLLGLAHNAKTPKALRLQAIKILGRLGRKYAEPAAEKTELPALAKSKDKEIAAEAKLAMIKMGPAKRQPQRQDTGERPLQQLFKGRLRRLR